MNIRSILAVVGLAVLFGATVTASSQAANTRVSISDFTWSKSPEINRGESVTWDWLGPDLQHSVTGQEDNSRQWDSNPGTSMPLNPLGHSFAVTFNEPGQYLFACKLHSSVRGTVIVSNTLGDPNSDPGPQPPLNFDMHPPFVDGIRLLSPTMGPKGKGGPFEFSTNEKGSADADYYKLVKRGKRTVKRYVGYRTWSTYVGINRVRFGSRTKTFKAKPGRYEAQFRVTDESNNTTRPYKIQFEIKGKKKKGKKNKKRR